MRQSIIWIVVTALLSGGILTYLIGWVSPYLSSGEQNIAAVILFVVALTAFVGSVASAIVLRLHQRWPSLAGGKRVSASGIPAIRQGGLIALSVGAMTILAVVKLLDFAFILVILLLAGLTEAFLQRG